MPLFNLTPDELTRLARAEGFDLAGVVALDTAEEQGSEDHGKYLEDWIAAGHAGEMDYLKRRNEQGTLLRSQVQAAIPWARSVIVCAASYNAPGPLSTDPAPLTTGWIARYAWAGQRDASTGELRPSDYHDTLLARLRGRARGRRGERGRHRVKAPHRSVGPVGHPPGGQERRRAPEELRDAVGPAPEHGAGLYLDDKDARCVRLRVAPDPHLSVDLAR